MSGGGAFLDGGSVRGEWWMDGVGGGVGDLARVEVGLAFMGF